MLKIDEWIQQGNEEYEQHFYSRNLHSSNFLHGNDERNSDFQGNERRSCAFSARRGKNAAYFRQFKPGYFMYTGPGSQETWMFEKYPDNSQGLWD